MLILEKGEYSLQVFSVMLLLLMEPRMDLRCERFLIISGDTLWIEAIAVMES